MLILSQSIGRQGIKASGYLTTQSSIHIITYNMGRNRNRNRRDRHPPRSRDDQPSKPEDRPYHKPGYPLVDRENSKSEVFENYYKKQEIVPEGEWDQFMATLRMPLHTTFRVTGFRSDSKELLKIIKGEYLSKLMNIKIENTPLDPPKSLPWYPDEMAWQINLDRQFLRRSETVKSLHKFLVSESESGNISRQEAVSMIPPLVLDVKSHHKVLDMCAAPGSKTAQLIEMLHADENNPIPEGFVMANDKENKRCYLMTHQVKRLETANFMVINHDATRLPKILIKGDNGESKPMYFDRILCDVPCSGDGTMRKNPDIWNKWSSAAALNLFSIQTRILRRGLELLDVGGRLVYSTCSFNPIEDEAVLASTILDGEGAIELVDVSSSLEGLKYMPGKSKWKVMTRQQEWFDKFEDVPERMHSFIRPQMFPPTEEQAEKIGLNRCMRVLPHQQDTGGFFIAVLIKTAPMPWQNMEKIPDNVQDANAVEKDNAEEDETGEPPRKRQKGRFQKEERKFGYKEDPFIFLKQEDEFWPSVKEFYGIAEDFPVTQLMVRCEQGKRRNVYFTSKEVKDVVTANPQIKFINMGIKFLSRSDSEHVKCKFRLVQEGISVMEQYIKDRRVKINKEDVITMMSQENPFLNKMTQETQDQLGDISMGALVFDYHYQEGCDGPKCPLILTGWRGKVSCRTFLPRSERSHYLRLCGGELFNSDDKREAATAKAGIETYQYEKGGSRANPSDLEDPFADRDSGDEAVMKEDSPVVKKENVETIPVGNNTVEIKKEDIKENDSNATTSTETEEKINIKTEIKEENMEIKTEIKEEKNTSATK